ncbi:uncharacterized protein LOC100823080 [Brachypodium distachyon]|uniref:Uncharacterized protein n=1 Tax=Brachypodium distachyon TaxID=15368 RepID=I1I171_BRADI|nr:uncharacterized protein LOC100823080 [Brachypodium distachyon]KQJ95215.1 hypothetical protein BRADI_3g15830v3 [Brachypodium distachyon]|eukprot:XP_003573421.1 uncharacterized protein LOC100823080 [Brachypodium distachyon]
MAKLAVRLKSKFFGLVGRITVCGRAGNKDAAANGDAKSASSQHVEIRSRGAAPVPSGGSKSRSNEMDY